MNGDAGNLVGKVPSDFGGVDERGYGVDDGDLLEGAENFGRLGRIFYLATSVSLCVSHLSDVWQTEVMGCMGFRARSGIELGKRKRY